MNKVEKISEIAMQVITYAGLAKSKYLEGLSLYGQKDMDAFVKSMDEGDESFNLAHEAHFDILQDEMNLGEPQITMLLAHAEDQLMAAETIKTLINAMVKLMEDVRKEK